jgi:hypothetical protein
MWAKGNSAPLLKTIYGAFKTEHDTTGQKVTLQVLTAATLKIAVGWDVELCSVEETDRHFEAAYCLYHQGDESGQC